MTDPAKKLVQRPGYPRDVVDRLYNRVTSKIWGYVQVPVQVDIKPVSLAVRNAT